MAVVGGAGQIASNGLAWYLDFANPRSYPGTGTSATDLSGNGRTGTLENGPTFSSSNSGILTFDGTDDRVNMGAILPLGGSDLSLGAWFRLSSSASTSVNHNLIHNFGTGGYRLLTGWDGSKFVLNYQIRAADNSVQAISSFTSVPTIQTNTWYYAALTHQNSNNEGKLYLNGVLERTVTFTITRAASSNTLYLGFSSNNIHYFNGSMSNATIHTSILTENEILQNFNALRGRFGL